MVAGGVVFLEVPGVAAHVVDVAGGAPAQLGLRLGGVAVAGGDVARAAWLDGVGHVQPVRLLKGVHHVEHRVAVACAQVVDGEALALLDGLQCGDVSGGEVHDVDVVAHSGAVGGVIVVAKDSQLLASANGGLGDVGHEVVGDAVGVLAYESALVRPDGVEVAQQHHVPLIVGVLHVDEHLLEHALGLTVGVGAVALGAFLGDGDDGGVAIYCCRRREDDVLAAVAAHRVEEHKGGVHVVLVVLERLGDALAHGLESGEVNHGVDVVLLKDGVHSLAVAHVGLDKRHRLADDFLHAPQCLGLRVYKVINHDHLVAGLVEFDDCVAANVSSPTSKQYQHSNTLIL